MRLELILIILLIILGGSIYYKDGTITNPFTSATTTASGVSMTDRFFGWFDFTDKENEKVDDVTEANSRANTASESRTETTAKAATPAVDSSEMEAQADAILERLEELQESEKVDELRSPVSPYAGSFNFSAGKAKATDPDDEYVILTASRSNASPIEISGWTVESYVTNRDAEIPYGDRMLLRYNAKDETRIYLSPGETAYLISGDTPLRTSFKENLCTGYLTQYGNFVPRLDKKCPLPTDELLQYGNLRDDDEACYEFVDTIRQCEEISDSEIDDAGLPARCDSFIDGVLEYEGCVQRHEDDADFDTGDWYVYLDSTGELWRSTKEVIRLLDEADRVVAVIEY